MKRITAITWHIVGGEHRFIVGGETSHGRFEVRTGGASVKHWLVERPTDWPYSSIHRDIAQAGLIRSGVAFPWRESLESRRMGDFTHHLVWWALARGLDER